MEIERKFEIGGFPEGLVQTGGAEVEQGYLSCSPVVRIRRSAQADGEWMMLCIKGKGTLEREEIELPVTRDVYDRIARLIGLPLIRKDWRTYALPGGLRLEVNCVDAGEPTSFFYAEVEFESLQAARDFVPPSFLGKELTELPNASMNSYWLYKKAVAEGRDPGFLLPWSSEAGCKG